MLYTLLQTKACVFLGVCARAYTLYCVPWGDEAPECEGGGGGWMGNAGDWGGVEYLGLVVSRCFNDDKE